MKLNAALLFVFLFLSASIHGQEMDPMSERIQKQMKAPDRHQFDLRRDKHRKPYESFRFLGLREGMVAMDVGAYAGYTTEMLAAAVGSGGKVYSHNQELVLSRYADGYYEETIKERLQNNRLPNVILHITEYDDLGLSEELDFAFLGNLIHDFHYRDGDENAVAFLSSIRMALKPGGILGVTDHVGIAGQNNAGLHRIEPDIARKLLREAGFVIEAESELFANPQDDHTLMVYDEAIYLRTDRFLIRARKAESSP